RSPALGSAPRCRPAGGLTLGAAIGLLQSGVGQLKVRLPRSAVLRHFTSTDHALPSIGNGESVSLGKTRRLPPPRKAVIKHRAVVLPRNATLIEVKHEALAGSVIASEHGDARWNVWLLDFGVHHQESSAEDPFKGCFAMKHRIRDVGMRPHRL